MIINLTEHGQLELVRATPDGFLPAGRFTPTLDGRNGLHTDDLLLKFPAWTAPVVAREHLFVRGNDRLASFDLSRTP